MTQLKVFTLPFSEAVGGFPDEAVRRFLVGKRVLRMTDHFFERDGLPHLALVVWYAETEALSAIRPPLAPLATAAATLPDAASAPTADGDYRTILKEADWPVFKALKAWRAERARGDGVPPYVIATNKVLAEVAVQRPQSRAALGAIQGFGEAKVARYADAMLALLPIGPAPGAERAAEPVTAAAMAAALPAATS